MSVNKNLKQQCSGIKNINLGFSNYKIKLANNHNNLTIK